VASHASSDAESSSGEESITPVKIKKKGRHGGSSASSTSSYRSALSSPDAMEVLRTIADGQRALIQALAAKAVLPAPPTVGDAPAPATPAPGHALPLLATPPAPASSSHPASPGAPAAPPGTTLTPPMASASPGPSTPPSAPVPGRLFDAAGAAPAYHAPGTAARAHGGAAARGGHPDFAAAAADASMTRQQAQLEANRLFPASKALTLASMQQPSAFRTFSRMVQDLYDAEARTGGAVPPVDLVLTHGLRNYLLTSFPDELNSPALRHATFHQQHHVWNLCIIRMFKLSEAATAAAWRLRLDLGSTVQETKDAWHALCQEVTMILAVGVEPFCDVSRCLKYAIKRASPALADYVKFARHRASAAEAAAWDARATIKAINVLLDGALGPAGRGVSERLVVAMATRPRRPAPLRAEVVAYAQEARGAPAESPDDDVGGEYETGEPAADALVAVGGRPRCTREHHVAQWHKGARTCATCGHAVYGPGELPPGRPAGAARGAPARGAPPRGGAPGAGRGAAPRPRTNPLAPSPLLRTGSATVAYAAAGGAGAPSSERDADADGDADAYYDGMYAGDIYPPGTAPAEYDDAHDDAVALALMTLPVVAAPDTTSNPDTVTSASPEELAASKMPIRFGVLLAGTDSTLPGVFLWDTGSDLTLVTAAFLHDAGVAMDDTSDVPTVRGVDGVPRRPLGRAKLPYHVHAVVDGKEYRADAVLDCVVVAALPLFLDLLLSHVHADAGERGGPLAHLRALSHTQRVTFPAAGIAARRHPEHTMPSNLAAAVTIDTLLSAASAPVSWPDAAAAAEYVAFNAEEIHTTCDTLAAMLPPRTAPPDFDAMVCPDLPPAQRTELVAVLEANAAVFGEIGSDGRSPPVRADFRLKPDAVPFNHGPTRVSAAAAPLLEAWILESVKIGTITEIPPPAGYVSRLLAVVKRDSTPTKPAYRFVVNLVPLNGQLDVPPHSVPSVDDILDRLRGAAMVSVVDARRGYDQLLLTDKAAAYINFGYEGKFYRMNKLPMGLASSATTYQMAMELALAPLIATKRALVYQDDTLVTSSDAAHHAADVAEALRLLHDFAIKLAPLKAKVGRRSVEILGWLWTSRGTISVAPSRFQAVRDTKAPTTQAELRSWLAFVSFFRAFLPTLPRLLEPIMPLAKQGASVRRMWSRDCDAAVAAVRAAILDAPPRYLFDPARPIVLVTDASLAGIAAILMQPHAASVGDVAPDPLLEGGVLVDKLWRQHHRAATGGAADAGALTDVLVPVAATSRRLLDAESRYSAVELECLSVVAALTKFSQYVEGRSVLVITDAADVTSVLQQTDARSPRIRRWRLFLMGFSLTFVHMRGEANGSDFLSRSPPAAEAAVLPAVVTRQEGGGRRVPALTPPATSDADVVDSTTAATPAAATTTRTLLATRPIVATNHDIVREVEAAQSAVNAPTRDALLRNADFRLAPHPRATAPLLWWRDALFIPREAVGLQQQLLAAAHDRYHPGRDRTLAYLVAVRVCWPGMRASVDRYIDTCLPCRLERTRATPGRRGLLLADAPPDVWQVAQLDHLGPLVRTPAGNVYVLVVVDVATRWTVLVPVPDTTGMTTVRALVERVLATPRPPPAVLHSDGSTSFTNHEMATFVRAIGAVQRISTPHSPTGHANVERTNGEVVRLLRMLPVMEREAWDVHLPAIEFYINTMPNATLGVSPYEAATACKPFTPATLLGGVAGTRPDVEARDAATFRAYVDRQYQKLAAHAAGVRAAALRAANARREDVEFKIGDRVVITVPRAAKLDTANVGPFEVVARRAPTTYELQDTTDASAKRVTCNAARMTLFDASRVTAQSAVQHKLGDGYYLVRGIADHRHRAGRLELLMQWKGYPDSANTWEPASGMRDLKCYKTYARRHGLPA